MYTPGVYLHRGVYCAYERGLERTNKNVYIHAHVSIFDCLNHNHC